MSQALTINATSLLPIKEVVGRTSYTRDYIARLARDGLIVGAQVGRQWYIDPTSLSRFAETSALEADIRRRHLSHKRRREREVAQVIEARSGILARQKKFQPLVGLLRTGVIVGVGLYTGYLFHQVPSIVASTAWLQKATVPVPDAVTQLVEAPPATVVFSEQSASVPVVFAEINETERLTADQPGVLLLPVGGDQNGRMVADLFSDPVTIAYETDTSGTVTLAQKTGTSTALAFVTVPVTAPNVSPPTNQSSSVAQ